MSDTLIIRIGKQDIEVEEIDKFPVAITYNLENITDFQQKRSAEAFDIVVPATNNNSKALNTFHDPSAEDFTNGGQYRNPMKCAIVANGREVLVGQALLQSAKHTDKPESYRINCYGNNGDWILPLRDKTLWDFVNTQTHVFDKATVEASWNFDGNSYINDYVYAPVRYRQPFDDTDTKVTMYHMRPSISIFWLLLRAFQSVGYNFQSTLFNLSQYRKLVLPWVWGNFLRIDSKLLDVLKFKASGQPSSTAGYNGYMLHAIGGLGNMFGTETLKYGLAGGEWNMTNDNQLGMYDNDNTYNSFTAGPSNGAMSWTYPVAQYNKFGKLSVGFHLSLQLGYDIDYGSKVDIYLDIYKNGAYYTTVNVDSQTAPATGQRQRPVNGSPYDVFFEVPDLVGNDTVAVYIKYNYTKSVFGSVSIEATSSDNGIYKKSYFEIQYFKKPIGGIVDFKLYDRLKDYKILDLIAGLCDCFDIIPQSDPVNKIVVFEPAHPYKHNDASPDVFDGFFKSDRLNWTDKQDLSKESELISYTDADRQQIFQFKEDANDGGANKYKGRYSIVPGSAKYLFTDRFKEGDKKIVNRFFAPVMHVRCMQWKNITGKVPQLIAMIPENISNTSANENELTFEPRIAYYKGLMPRADYGGWNWDGDTTKNLPYMFAVNYIEGTGGQYDPILTYNDQNIGGVLARGLMKRHFLPRLAIMEYGKLYNTWMNLKYSDVANWLHRERIMIGNGAYLLYSIDKYNPFSDDSVACTFWKYFPVTAKNEANCYPSSDSVINQPAQISSVDMKYAPLLLLNTDIPQ